jgi:AraC-like DNA-binding protein
LKIQFSLFDLLISIGILQGIITGFLLLNSKKNVRSNKFLGLAILSFCLLSTKPLLHTLYLWDTNLFRFFPNGIELALPPLFYFYMKSLVNPKFRFKSKDWVHFIPFLLSQTYAFIVYFSVLKTNNFNEKDGIAESFGFNYIKQLDEYLLLISLAFYLFYGYKELRNYKKWLDNTTSDSTFPDFGWLKDISRLSIIIGAFLLVNHSLDIFFNLRNDTVLHWNLLTLYITFLIYYLGLKGYLQPDYTFNKDEIIVDTISNSVLSDTKITKTIEQLNKVMNADKVFLNPKLSIYELSNTLGVSQKSLSLAINQHFKISFREFINNYRLEEVKSKLNDSNYSHMSILGIALECGFNSEASFYRIFKKSTGVSPKEFIQRKNTD